LNYPALPLYVSIVFILATIFTFWFLFEASGRSKTVLPICLAWLVLQAVISLSGFYLLSDTMPPRFALMPGPPVVFILILFLSKRGRNFIDSLNQKILTYLHVVRIAVELVLFWLFLHKLVPQLMTLEGRNFDIIAGISAPIMAYYGYTKMMLNRTILLLWNFICLGLLLNIVVNGILSAPTPFQKFAFDQPNVAVLQFPFVWLPAFIVPVVLLAHLAVIRRLILNKASV
jgi:hypothetical protein